MKYICIIFLLIAAIHPISYAKYNLSKKNWIGAAGAILLAVLAVIMPAYLLLYRN